jgi:hypothetical protein
VLHPSGGPQIFLYLCYRYLSCAEATTGVGGIHLVQPLQFIHEVGPLLLPSPLKLLKLAPNDHRSATFPEFSEETRH